MSEAIAIPDDGELVEFTLGNDTIVVDLNEAADVMASALPKPINPADEGKQLTPQEIPPYVNHTRQWLCEKYKIDVSYHKTRAFIEHVNRLWGELQKKTSPTVASPGSTDSILRVGPNGSDDATSPTPSESEQRNESSGATSPAPTTSTP